MSDYGVYGTKGTGTSKFAVWRARDALLEGRRVATNLDLYLDKLIPSKRVTYTRVPDRPTAADLQALGRGYEGPYNEDRFGLLILDELATWLNSRSYGDKDRAALIDWLVHARKLGWDCYYLVQGLNMIDKQVREPLIEYEVRCMRMDKVKIPVIGGLLASIYKPLGYLPKFHMATARVGQGATSFVAERWNYMGKDIHAGYNTEQVFDASYPHGVHTVVPPWDHNPPPSTWDRLRRKLGAPRHEGPPVAPKPKPRVMHLLSTLPPHERIRHVQRLERLGLLR